MSLPVTDRASPSPADIQAVFYVKGKFGQQITFDSLRVDVPRRDRQSLTATAISRCSAAPSLHVQSRPNEPGRGRHGTIDRKGADFADLTHLAGVADSTRRPRMHRASGRARHVGSGGAPGAARRAGAWPIGKASGA